MSAPAVRLVRIVICTGLMSCIARACLAFHTIRATAAMCLLLAVLGIATLGDSLLAILTSIAASLSFSYFFLSPVETFTVGKHENLVAFVVLVITALTGSQLSIRAQRRASEANGRREEMERLHQLGSALMAAGTVTEAGERAVHEIKRLFDLRGAILRLDDREPEFRYGDFAPATDASALQDVHRVQLNSGPGRMTLELYGQPPSGEVCNAIANLVSLVIDRARSAQMRAHVESAKRTEELRSTVLNALAHNFKTPLTSIKAAASMLRGSQATAGSHGQELIAVIDEEADRLDQLIRESLDLARIEAHSENPREESVAVADVVESVCSKISRYLGNRKLIVDLPDSSPIVRGDRFLYEQMLLQVVDNAWKHSKPGAQIRISAQASESAAIIAVHNTGVDVPVDERELIFDKFFRGIKNRSKVEGTGLGLSIAKTIVEAHGGRLWLDSEPDGPTFCFAVPLDVTEGERDREPHNIGG